MASGGNEAIELLRQKEYNVVLLDLKMSGCNGDSVMSEINRKDAGIKTIFITAYNDSGKTKKRLLEEGAYAFLEKPVTSLKLLEDLVNKAAEADK